MSSTTWDRYISLFDAELRGPMSRSLLELLLETQEEILANSTKSYVLVVDSKPDGTAGGTFTSGDWRTRDINTKLIDTDSLCSIASNQITLQAGTWRFYADLPAHRCNAHRARFQNVTDGTTVQLSRTVVSASTDSSDDGAILFGQFTITSPKTFEFQHWCETTKTTDGFGVHDQGMAGGVAENFTRAEFWRIAV